MTLCGFYQKMFLSRFYVDFVANTLPRRGNETPTRTGIDGEIERRQHTAITMKSNHVRHQSSTKSNFLLLIALCYCSLWMFQEINTDNRLSSTNLAGTYWTERDDVQPPYYNIEFNYQTWQPPFLCCSASARDGPNTRDLDLPLPHTLAHNIKLKDTPSPNKIISRKFIYHRYRFHMNDFWQNWKTRT